MKIKELILLSKDLEAQRKFYSDVLNLKTTRWDEGFISYKINKTRLEFRKSEVFKRYHFAFNIPPHTLYDKLSSLQKKIKILEYNGKEIVDFPAWKAQSIYFYDADGNILELIARQERPKIETDSGDLLEVSEIGVATENVHEKYELLNRTGVPLYSGKPEIFCAMGSERGLFILINKKKKSWIPTDDKAESANFTAVVSLANQEHQVSYQNDSMIIEKILR